MRANHVKRRLAADEPSVGTWLALLAPESAEYVGALGFDWLVVDMEHNAIDIRTAAQMCAVLTRSASAPLVRIPSNSTENIRRVLDAGAWGVVVSMVNSRADAEQAVAAMRYPPHGIRGVGSGRHVLSFETTAPEYYRHANDELLLIVQIEHIDGVEHADDIASVPGVDVCFVGPTDLAASMGLGLGLPLESDEPHVNDAIAHVLQACQARGVAPGIHASNAAAVMHRIAEGFRFCAMASELRYMLAGLRADLAQLDWHPSAPATLTTGDAGPLVRY